MNIDECAARGSKQCKMHGHWFWEWHRTWQM